ncbi:MAG: hypothetical protein AAFR51_03930 [Pseudomonadota bacterium]
MSRVNKKPDLGASFDASKGSRYVDITTSANATASAELENAKKHEQAMDAHNQRWVRERDRLAVVSDLYPEFDLGSRAHRNLLSAYEERRTQWQKQADQIDNGFEVKRDHLRNTGRTVSNEFKVQTGAAFERFQPEDHIASEPCTDKDKANSTSPRLQSRADEFLVHGHDRELVKTR